MREDTRTTTVADAGAYEALRGSNAGEDFDSMRPSRSDLAHEAYHDRIAQELRQKREQAARARGEYVPTMWTQGTCQNLSWTLDNAKALHAGVAIIRDGVFRIDPLPGCGTDGIAAALSDFDGEVLVSDNVVWVRSEDSRWDKPPF